MRLESNVDLWKIAVTGPTFHKAHAENKTSIDTQKLYVKIFYQFIFLSFLSVISIRNNRITVTQALQQIDPLVPTCLKHEQYRKNVTSRRGSRHRDGASIVATSLQCRLHGIGPLDRRWRRRVCQSEPRLPTRRSTPSLAGVKEWRQWRSWRGRRTCLGRVVNTVWTDNIDNKLYVWTIPRLCLWWSSVGVSHKNMQEVKPCSHRLSHLISSHPISLHVYWPALDNRPYPVRFRWDEMRLVSVMWMLLNTLDQCCCCVLAVWVGPAVARRRRLDNVLYLCVKPFIRVAFSLLMLNHCLPLPLVVSHWHSCTHTLNSTLLHL